MYNIESGLQETTYPSQTNHLLKQFDTSQSDYIPPPCASVNCNPMPSNVAT